MNCMDDVGLLTVPFEARQAHSRLPAAAKLCRFCNMNCDMLCPSVPFEERRKSSFAR